MNLRPRNNSTDRNRNSTSPTHPRITEINEFDEVARNSNNQQSSSTIPTPVQPQNNELAAILGVLTNLVTAVTQQQEANSIQITNLLNRIADRNPSDIVQQQSIPPSPERPTKMKMSIPKFTGSRDELRYFIARMEDYFLMNSNECNTDRKKIIKTASLFDEAPSKWYYNLKDSQNDTWATFRERLETAYGNPTEKLWARSNLVKLKQGSRACSSYTHDFEKYENLAGYDSTALKSIFIGGLKEELQKLITLGDTDIETISMKDLKNLAKMKDDKLHYLVSLNKSIEKKKESNSSTDNNKKRHSDHDKKSDKNKRNKSEDDKSSEDKEKRKDKKCEHCEKPGHVKKNCYRWKREQKEKEKEKKKDKSKGKDKPTDETKSLKD
jgi:hypothetical protein